MKFVNLQFRPVGLELKPEKTEDNYACRLNKLNLLSLEKRLLLADVTFFYTKLLMGLLTSMLNLTWIFIRKLITILLDIVIS